MKNAIALISPEIPYNTGNIARTCVVTDTALHLVRPLGFQLTDRLIRRSGMDYWDDVDLTVWDSLEAFAEYADEVAAAGTQVLYVETRTPRSIGDLVVSGPVLSVFGQESKGIPEDFMAAHPERLIRIPMRPGSRSLNLSNSAAIVLFEVLRQQGYPHMD
ncbi:MAG: tRNA (cytidine(34)-2'-O)-methyltransferase [Peptoniphilaceae bacterium]|nr:tRNA (cytidine(34)-2'-O)-methyltransferase [Peptoniphilaceae bacterium]MDY6085906.1 tRNA (cytidine(34)-2'-O)-methyltransferase [Peptoniphilaceae bacterium]